MSNLRDYKGYQVSDDFTHNVKSRDAGIITLNLQELMAYKLHMQSTNAVGKWYDSQGGPDVLSEYQAEFGIKVSYNHIRDLRNPKIWNPAKDSFVLQNSITDAVSLESIAPHRMRGKTSDGIKFNATNASELGKAVFNSLPVDLQVFLSNYNRNDTDFSAKLQDATESVDGEGNKTLRYLSRYAKNTTAKGRMIRRAIQGFKSGMHSEMIQINHEVSEKNRILAEQELAEKQELARGEVIETLRLIGITAPDAPDAPESLPNDATKDAQQEYEVAMQSYEVAMQEYEDRVKTTLQRLVK